ncbi:MAG: hypothetical protein J1F28_01030 [Oscillospiraceae bacterium]|nr:hypothetical protein [Oscillospiraceae bacterium]
MPFELTEDERYLSAHISDLISLSLRSGVPRFSAFLNEREAAIAAETARAEGAIPVFFGGYEGASRTVCGFFESTYGEDFAGDAKNGLFPIRVVSFAFRERDNLSHRDFLGAIMSLGIKRETVGDIVVNKGGGAVFCLEAEADLILGITKIGNVGVCAEDKLTVPIEKPEPVRFTASVPSMRLDCIVGACTNASRDKSASLVKSGLVSADFSVCLEVSKTVAEDSVLSIRGYGKFKVSKIVGVSKKGRIRVEIEKYV